MNEKTAEKKQARRERGGEHAQIRTREETHARAFLSRRVKLDRHIMSRTGNMVILPSK